LNSLSFKQSSKYNINTTSTTASNNNNNSEVSSSSSFSIGACNSFYAGLFTEQGNIKTGNQDIIMYDRLPRYNHEDVELPSKLEWFVCPEGPKTVESIKR
jgi:hypothetical protein